MSYILAHPGHFHGSGPVLIALAIIAVGLMAALITAAVRDIRRSRR